MTAGDMHIHEARTGWRPRRWTLRLAGLGFVVVLALAAGGLLGGHGQRVAVASDPGTPTLTTVNEVSSGLSFAFVAPVPPVGATISGYQYDVSTNGGTTWLGSLNGYYGST